MQKKREREREGQREIYIYISFNVSFTAKTFDKMTICDASLPSFKGFLVD